MDILLNLLGLILVGVVLPIVLVEVEMRQLRRWIAREQQILSALNDIPRPDFKGGE